MEREVQHWIKPCRPECVLAVRPSERLREVLREERYTEVDADCWRIHRKSFPAGEGE